MHIGPVTEADFERLLEIWEAAVRATHDFLSEEHISFYRRRLREVYFYEVELSAVGSEAGDIAGFMGLLPPRRIVRKEGEEVRRAVLAMLFVHPDRHGRGFGSALVRHAADTYGALNVDVNEQNPAALRFYLRRGFVQTDRSETDEEGNPFPLIHLTREADTQGG